jgi:DNA-binding NtrC family response regulator
MTVLQQVNFNKKRAAEVLKIDRKTLYNKIKNTSYKIKGLRFSKKNSTALIN